MFTELRSRLIGDASMRTSCLLFTDFLLQEFNPSLADNIRFLLVSLELSDLPFVKLIVILLLALHVAGLAFM